MRQRTCLRFLLPAALAALSACAPLVRPVIDHRGYVPDESELSSITLGVDTKTSVVGRLGTPSAEAGFDGSTWYYISTDQRSFLYNRPKIIKENVVAIRFDDNSVVSEINHYGLEDHQVINYVKRETPTRGKELTLLQQLLGNVGRISTEAEPESPRGSAP